MLGNVDCNGEESTLLECDNHNYNCRHNEDVSVRCILREDQRVKNITLDVDVINAPSTVLVCTLPLSLGYCTTLLQMNQIHLILNALTNTTA